MAGGSCNLKFSYRIFGVSVWKVYSPKHYKRYKLTADYRPDGIFKTLNSFFLKQTTDLSLILPKHSIENQTELKKYVT